MWLRTARRNSSAELVSGQTSRRLGQHLEDVPAPAEPAEFAEVNG